MSTYIGPGYLETFGIDLVAGRNFSGEPRDSASFIINESAVNDFGLGTPQEAVGREIEWSQFLKGKVIGVVKDFHLRSLHEAIGPVTMLQTNKVRWYTAFLSVKSDPASINETIEFLQERYAFYEKELPFEYFMIEDSYRMIHEDDLNFAHLSKIFSTVAIFIALMGLFGLVNIELSKRMKEVGIRKVLGATVGSIIFLMSKGYMQLISIAFVIACGITYFVMNKWLENFAYHIRMEVWYFLSAGVLLGLIAFVTMSFKSIRAAQGNPVEALRYE